LSGALKLRKDSQQAEKQKSRKAKSRIVTDAAFFVWSRVDAGL
jgi:hypothetical protein